MSKKYSTQNNLEIITLNAPEITDFASARNSLLEKSKAEWIFFVDSDEVVTDTLRKEINEVVNSAKFEKFNGFYVKRDNYFLRKYSGTDNIIRLGRKNVGSWKRMVHETWHINGKVGQLKNPLIHYTADSVYRMIEKINEYSTLHAIANLKEGKKSNLFRIIFMPMLKFLQSLKMHKGFVLSILMSFHSFLSWVKQWELQRD